MTNLTVSPVRKTVKFDSNFTQYNISDDEDDELFALLENIEQEKKEGSANVVTQVALENESFDSGILFSGNDSLFDASFTENNTLKTIDPGMSLEVGLAKDGVDQSEAEDDIISLSSVYAATNSITMESKYVPKLMTTESFSLEKLAYNIKNINPTLALDPLSVLFGLDAPRRLVGPAALMVQKVRKIGPTMQMTFIDGKGTEIVGTMCGNSLPDCKVHYGMIVILQDVRRKGGYVTSFLLSRCQYLAPFLL